MGMRWSQLVVKVILRVDSVGLSAPWNSLKIVHQMKESVILVKDAAHTLEDYDMKPNYEKHAKVPARSRACS